MTRRLLIGMTLFTSATCGAGTGVWLWSAVGQSPRAGPQGVELGASEGTEGLTDPRETFTSSAGELQSIRGIRGIDTVMLQNLEAVLRMQAPPLPPQDGGGGSRAAAALLTMDNEEPPDPETEPDGRDELTEIELEGS